MRAAQQTGKLNLAPGGLEQVFAANHEIDVLQPVVDRHSKLIRPVSVAISYEQVSALRSRILEAVAPFPEARLALADALAAGEEEDDEHARG